MNRKILIQSKQSFESHEDFASEECDAKVIINEDGFEISYEGSNIKFYDNKLMVKRDNMAFEICLNQITVASYNTPYGDIDLSVCGREFYFCKEPFLFKVKYDIKFGSSSKYLNELQINFKD